MSKVEPLSTNIEVAAERHVGPQRQRAAAIDAHIPVTLPAPWSSPSSCHKTELESGLFHVAVELSRSKLDSGVLIVLVPLLRGRVGTPSPWRSDRTPGWPRQR